MHIKGKWTIESQGFLNQLTGYISYRPKVLMLIALSKTKGVNLEAMACMTAIVSIGSDFNQMTMKGLPIANGQYHSIVN